MRTHAIVHLENTVEMQDTELDEMEQQIADLLHQVHEL
jgi:cell division protein FtsL